MNTKRYISDHWKGLATAAFAIAVFCFWVFCLPHLIIAREGMQLFLWNTDYLVERIRIPGGGAQWLGECIVQFFQYPIIGACWYVFLLTAIQRLTWRLSNNVCSRFPVFRYLLSFIPSIFLWFLSCIPDIPTTPIVAVLITLTMMSILPKEPIAGLGVSAILIPIGYWMVGPIAGLLPLYALHWLWYNISKKKVCCATTALVILLAFCIWGSSFITPYPLRQLVRGIDYYWEDNKTGNLEEMEYDMMTRQLRWADIVKRYEQKPTESIAIRNTVQLAKWKLHLISLQDLAHSLTLTNKAQKSIVSAFLISETGMHVGTVSISQRSAFEAMEAIPNYNKSGRALRRLVETNLIMGQYEVALKYISILEDTLFYRNWAHRIKPLAEDPLNIKKWPYYQRLKETFENDKDTFFV